MSMKRVELIFPSDLDEEQESLCRILMNEKHWRRVNVDQSDVTCLLKSLSAVLGSYSWLDVCEDVA